MTQTVKGIGAADGAHRYRGRVDDATRALCRSRFDATIPFEGFGVVASGHRVTVLRLRELMGIEEA